MQTIPRKSITPQTKIEKYNEQVTKCEIEDRYMGVIEKIKEYAQSHGRATFERIGINPEEWYDLDSKEFLEIIKKLEEEGIDLTSCEFSDQMKYINAIILKEQESYIFANIDDVVKESPVELLKHLMLLYENNKENKLYNHYVLEKLIVQAEIWKLMQNNPKLNRFPFVDIWRFCIDVEKQKYGAYIFEDEPGYIVGYLNALHFSLKLKSPNFWDYIKINQQCGKDVYASFSGNRGYLSTTLRSICPGNFGIVDFSNIGPEGLQDLQERSKVPGNFFILDGSRLHIGLYDLEKNVMRMQFLFAEHEKRIALAKNKEERLMAHLWLARELELHHHFIDGNGRSSNVLLLSLLANDRELPMILYDTDLNLMDGDGPVRFVKRIVTAMRNFNQTCGIEEAPMTFKEVKQNANLSDKQLWSAYHPTDMEYKAFLREKELEKLPMIKKQICLYLPLIWKDSDAIMKLMMLILIAVSAFLLRDMLNNR